MFNPDFSSKNSVKKEEVVVHNLPPLDSADQSKEVLSMSNMLKSVNQHIIDDRKCTAEYNLVNDRVLEIIDRLSPKELLEYMKVKLKEREFHADFIHKSYNYILRTELAKELLIGKDKKERVIDIKNREKISYLINIVKDNANFGK